MILPGFHHAFCAAPSSKSLIVTFICNICNTWPSNRYADNKTNNNLADKHVVDKVLGGDTHAFSLIIENTERLVEM